MEALSLSLSLLKSSSSPKSRFFDDMFPSGFGPAMMASNNVQQQSGMHQPTLHPPEATRRKFLQNSYRSQALRGCWLRLEFAAATCQSQKRV
jgi:hypothetical protein